MNIFTFLSIFKLLSIRNKNFGKFLKIAKWPFCPYAYFFLSRTILKTLNPCNFLLGHWNHSFNHALVLSGIDIVMGLWEIITASFTATSTAKATHDLYFPCCCHHIPLCLKNKNQLHFSFLSVWVTLHVRVRDVFPPLCCRRHKLSPHEP